MVVRFFVLAAFVVVGSVSGQAVAEPISPARACEPQATRVVQPRTLPTLGAAHEEDLALQWAPAVLLAANDPGLAELGSPALPATPGPANGRERRDLLAYLVVTHDLRIPGTSGMGLRLIPTRNALAGIPAPVVFIPRVVRSDWYGMEIVVGL